MQQDSQNRPVVIIGASPERDLFYAALIISSLKEPYIICADGGLRVAINMEVKPHLIVGDGDSAMEGVASVFPQTEVVRLEVEKDETDMKVCVDQALARGFRRIYMVCALGGRADHSLSNMALLDYIYAKGGEGSLHDSHNIITYLPGGEYTFARNPKYPFFGLIPIDDTLENVCLEGFHYSLENATVSRVWPISVCNQAVADRLRLSFSGRAYAILSRD